MPAALAICYSISSLFLMPSFRFRTRLCEKGLNCDRPLCFFAHVPEDLRVATGSAATASANASPCSTPEISPCTTPVAGSPLRFPPQLYADAYPFGQMQPSFDPAGGGSSSVGSAMPGPSTSPPSMLPSYTQGAIDNILAAANLINRPGTGGATPASSSSPVVTPRRGRYGTFSDFSDGSASPKVDMQAAAMTMGYDAGGVGPFSNMAAGTSGAQEDSVGWWLQAMHHDLFCHVHRSRRLQPRVISETQRYKAFASNLTCQLVAQQ